MHDYALHDLAETSEDEAADGEIKLEANGKKPDEEMGTVRHTSNPGYAQHQGGVNSAPRLSGSGRTRDQNSQPRTQPPGKP
jgi:hypothetical protein